MNKILLRLYVPIIERQFDIWVPVERKTESVIQLLIKGIEELSENTYIPTKETLLYDRTTGFPYDINKTIQESGIKNATEVILI